MKIIAYMEGTFALNASWDEFRPLIGAPYVVLAEFLKERYLAQNVGISPIAQQMGLMTPVLQHGRFGKELINQIEFLPNLIVVTCSKTATAAAVFKDLAESLREAFGFRVPPEDRRAAFRSTIVSDLGFGAAHTFGKWNEIGALVNKLRGSTDSSIEPLGIQFIERRDEGFDPNTQFVFQKRFNTPPNAEWVYSQAPLRTEDHEKLLQHIAKVFGAI
jgi:hypothetical protein